MKNLMDEDGENRAVRGFLLLYGTSCGVTVGAMRTHLRLYGFDGAWPVWVRDAHENEHLNKSSAQAWLRHLFSLEPK